jgi:hypothetical protein
MTEYYSNTIENFELVSNKLIGGPCTTNPITMSMATKQNCFPNQYPKNTPPQVELKPAQEVRQEIRPEVRTEVKSESNPCLGNPLSMSREVKSKCFPNQFPQEKESNIMMYLIVLTLLSVTSFCIWYFLMKKTEQKI